MNGWLFTYAHVYGLDDEQVMAWMLVALRYAGYARCRLMPLGFAKSSKSSVFGVGQTVAVLLPVLALFCPMAAQAQSTYDEGTDPVETGTTGTAEPDAADISMRIPCLEDLAADGSARKGVQVRPFLKKHRFEVAGLGGLYASDVLSSTYSFGGTAAFFPSEDFAVEIMVTRAPVKFALEDPFTGFGGARRFETGSANQAMLSMLFVPMQAKFKFDEETIFPADVFLVGGAGRTFHDSVQGLTWEGGVGMHLYLGHYFDFRIDVRDFIVPQEVLGKGRITNNLLVTAGLGVWVL